MNIFEFKDYRKFIKHWLVLEKKARRLNASMLSEKLRVHPTFVSQVLKGQKDLSVEQWSELCELIDLTDVERDYLQFLHSFNRAASSATKKFYQKKLDEVLKKRMSLLSDFRENRTLSESDKSIFFSSWLYSAIRLFCGVNQGQSVESIADKFAIPKAQVEDITNFLIAAGLCELDKKKIRMKDQLVLIPSSRFDVRHHTNWRLKMLNTLEYTTDKELNFTGVISVSHKDFGRIREKLKKTIKEVFEIVKDSPAEDVAVFTIDLIWPLKKIETYPAP